MTNHKKNWEQYGITSCAWEWIPTNVRGSGSTAVGPLFVFEDIDTSNTTGYTIEEILSLDSCKSLDPTRHHRGFINLRKITSQMDCPW